MSKCLKNTCFTATPNVIFCGGGGVFWASVRHVILCVLPKIASQHRTVPCDSANHDKTDMLIF